jgi:pantetheine-phosphate adenylyltransferase
MFDRVIIGVGTNPAKKHTFTQEERIALIKPNIRWSNVTIIPVPAGKLTADFAYEHRAVILKGVRMNAADFDYEWLMADINRAHVSGLRTIILPASPQYNSVSSSAAKELTKHHGNVHDFVPLNVKAALEQTLVNQKRITVTGTIGSGKSTIVAGLMESRDLGDVNYIRERDDINNIDLDVIAHDILFRRDEPLYHELRNELKEEFHIKEWNRKELGDVIFNDIRAREHLNHVIRQPILTRVRSELYGRTGTILFNGALIIEAGWLHLTNNRVILLDINEVTQYNRLKARGYTDQQIAKRVGSQFTTSRKEEEIVRRCEIDGFGTYRIINTGLFPVEQNVQQCLEFIDKVFPKT